MTDTGTESVPYGGYLEPDRGTELADLLHALGVDERPARVIGFLGVHGNGRSAKIEDALGMRQPEVSQATKSLRDWGWVRAEREKTPGKGRPVNNYQLAIPLQDLVAEVEERRREEINEELARLDRLVELVSPPPAETAQEEDQEAPTEAARST